MPKSLVPNQFDYAGIYVEGQRSNFRFRKPVASSFMAGMLTPCGDPIRVFPGVKLDLQLEAAIRGNTMIVPPLDGLYIDVFCVWVPDRIVWKHQAQFLGENDTTAWTQSTTYVYPYLTLNACNDMMNEFTLYADDPGVAAGNFSLFAHYGLANTQFNLTAFGSTKINALGIRGYYAIWNHLFRDENYQRPVLFTKDDVTSSDEFGYIIRNYRIASGTETLFTCVNDLSYGYQRGLLMPVNKFHDAYTSLLPQPQFDNGSGVSFLQNNSSAPVDFITTGAVTAGTNNLTGIVPSSSGSIGGLKFGTTAVKMVADLSAATSATINQLRTSIMYQRYLEALARGGRRAPEFYQTIYGVKNSVAAKDYPELLSRSRYLLGVNQVVATADTGSGNWTSHLGDTGAYLYTTLRNIPLCEKDFTEFGYLHILYCVRSENRYSQFVPEHFLRSTLLDEYNPYFDHIGDVGVKNICVNASAGSAGNFGFQEAWWFERTQLAMATGAINKAYGSLPYWTISELFDSSLTTCTPEYLTFNADILNDIFVSDHWVYPQFIGDFLIHGKKAARMSQHSIPGIVGRI